MVAPHKVGDLARTFVRIPGSGLEFEQRNVVVRLPRSGSEIVSGRNDDLQKLRRLNKNLRIEQENLRIENRLLKRQISLFKQLLQNPQRLNSVMQRIAEKNDIKYEKKICIIISKIKLDEIMLHFNILSIYYI